MTQYFNEEDACKLEEILRNRRDVRGNNFSDEPVSEEEVHRILDAALTAPSVGYSQPWKFVVIRDIDTRKQIQKSFLAENDKARDLFKDAKAEKYSKLKLEGIVEAPVNIAVFYIPSDEPVLGQTTMKQMGEYSVVCAIQNMWLMARAMNIGVGWVSILDPDKVADILDAPKNHRLIGYLCLGRVKEFLPEPELETLKWNRRLNKSTVLFYEKFKP
ncbi:MAG: 5,6-dimethylbenzimidazole synthase [Methyloligellaceae bacterium]